MAPRQLCAVLIGNLYNLRWRHASYVSSFKILLTLHTGTTVYFEYLKSCTLETQHI